jgi:hypothetical protein
MRGRLLLLAGILSLGWGAAAWAEPGTECQRTCGASAQRNGNSDIEATRPVSVPGTTVARLSGGGLGVVSEGSTRSRNRNTCPGCTYTTVPLIGPGAPGGRTGIPFLGCHGTDFAQTLLVYRTAPGQSGRTLVGTACPSTPAAPGAAAPVITLEMIEGEVRRLAQQVAPPAPELGFAPTGNAIVNLPVLVWATPQSTIRRDFAPFGIPVSVTLTPSWEWTFGPGATSRTTHPGQPYRDNGVPVARDPGYVTHSYRTPGARDVTVTVRWAATWSLDDGAPRALGDLTRSDTVGVSVREAPSRLVAR